MPSTIHTPHDSFIKDALSNINIEIAKDLLKPYLPPEMVKRIDWDTFQLTNKSFVDDALKQTHGDLIYKCLLKDKRYAYVYLFFDYYSIPNELLACGILKYNTLLMHQHLDEGHTLLPIILNVYLYTGSTPPYPNSRDIYECLVDIVQEVTELPRAELEEIIKRSR